MSHPEGLAIARRLIAEEAEKKTGFLDIGNLGFTELPKELFGVPHLRGLNLGRWYKDENEIYRLSSNSIGSNELSDHALESLRDLKLESLSVSEVALSNLLAISGIASLRALNCSYTKVTDLTPLAQLANLQSLNCSFTQVTDLTPLAQLANLQSLNCSFTQVTDLTPLAQLANVQSLNCGFTKVTDLTPLAQLANLQSVNCSNTKVTDLTPLAQLANLQSLECSGTQVNDVTPLALLANLQSLECSLTQVTDLTPLIGLRLLSTLDAGNCQLVSFPLALLRSETPIKLKLYGTKIPGIPGEVLSQRYGDVCRKSLLAHVNDLEAGAEQVVDVKVIVIGNGRIGKTQICNRLRGEPFEEQADSTHGITVTQSKLTMDEGSDPAVLNLWDFGGQDLYHGTHSLFLKSRAVFVVVWTPKAETNIEYEYGGMRFRNQPLPYWLDYVRNAAGSVCPVVLVQNQCDAPQDEVRQPPVDSELLDAFPYLQQVHYSAREDRKRDSLNEALREAIKHLRGQEGIATIGKGRMKVRRQLQQWLDEDAHRKSDRRQHRTLTQEQFRGLCTTAGDVSSPDNLLEYLHNAGIIFYRKGLFGDSIVLDQSWALDAIYTVFNREQCYRQLSLLGGRFTRSLLEALAWPAETYSREEQELFLSMMESCGICFKHREADRQGRFEAEYVAPDLLPDRASVADQLAGRWGDDGPKVERAWSFEFLHPGLARSIISTVGSQAGETAVYWKYGVWFYDANTRAAAIIAQEMQDDRQGRIVLQAQGDRARDLVASVTKWIADKLRDSGTANFTEDGEPIAGSNRKFSSESVALEDRRPAAEEAIRITDPPRPANQMNACVSYAWKEERSADPERASKVELFCKKLTEAGRSIIRDTTHVAFGDRLSAFMRQIGHGDCIYVFLSDAYLKSPNCMYELLTIWNTSGDDEEQFRLRTRVYTMPGTDVFSIPARLKYAAHWKKQLAETKQVINDNGVDVLGPTDLKHFKQMQGFAHNVNEMLAQIVDVLQPREFDQYIDQAIDELRN
jgi:internalin A